MQLLRTLLVIMAGVDTSGDLGVALVHAWSM
jgi:hypothetical protein